MRAYDLTVTGSLIVSGSTTLTGDISYDDVTATGNIETTGANKVISGSVTSTGSFGAAHISDRIGIGTVNPENKLDVQGSAGLLGRFKATSAGHAKILLDANGATGNPNLEFANDGNFKWRIRSQTNAGDDLLFVKGDDSLNS